MGISTHVLDTQRGQPAAGLDVTLHFETLPGVWELVGRGQTNAQGRVQPLLADAALRAGHHRLTFAVKPYLEAHHGAAFFPEVVIAFTVANPTQHFHVPLLLCAHGYSTYRGS